MPNVTAALPNIGGAQWRSQKFILGGYNFTVYDTTDLYTIAAA